MKDMFYSKGVIITLILLFSIGVDTCGKNISVTNSSNWIEQFSFEDATYIIRDVCDLKGKMLRIPKNSCLQFEGGLIKNGTIEGDNTCVEADSLRVFEHVTINGTWKNAVVYSEWLDFVEGKEVDNASNYHNLMILCRSDVMTYLYTQKGTFFCSVRNNGASNIMVPSNVYWHNSSTICQLPSDGPKSSLVLLHRVNNVTIDGGEFVGDVKTHIGNEGEWGHGIMLAGATNVLLKNLLTREFWGDGIDLIEADYDDIINAGVGNCMRITIENVKSLYNRRQGMSIEAAENVLVKNSEFAYTGKLLFTAPGSGVDIEPWCRNERKINNIVLHNCNIHDNEGGSDFCCMPNAMYRNNVQPALSPKNVIRVIDCIIGRLYVECVNDIKFENCEIDNVVHYSKGAMVVFANNRIRRRSILQSYEGAKFINIGK